ncbi:hypothetical protein GCM10010308_15790 [Streptomyces vinaceusdrappus]|nr:hypothetical protein GCM10010301_17720 [Streptomyces plicatus]GHC03895.1 hypothetical protein GCM10010308_15790 [Streptomyces vinaceusdrappus]
MGTSRVVPADVTCVAASALSSVACPGAACHNLAELPGVSGSGPGSPLWHGYLFATLSDGFRHPVQLAPSRRSFTVPGPLSGDRTQGSQQYSIRATCVDWHAARLPARGGVRPSVARIP